MLRIDPLLNNRHDCRPVVALDFDGVLNIEFPEKNHKFHLRDYKIGWHRISIKHDVLKILEPLLQADDDGIIQLAWGTAWDRDAPDKFAPECLSGVGSDWPVIYFHSFADETSHAQIKRYSRLKIELEDRFGVYYKTTAMAEFAKATNRRVIWLDDLVRAVDRRYLKARAEHDDVEQVMAITVNRATGLTRQVVARVLDEVRVLAN